MKKNFDYSLLRVFCCGMNCDKILIVKVSKAGLIQLLDEDNGFYSGVIDATGSLAHVWCSECFNKEEPNGS